MTPTNSKAKWELLVKLEIKLQMHMGLEIKLINKIK